MYFSIASNQTSTRAVRFGCRDIAILSPEAQGQTAKQEKIDFAHACLTEGGNPLAAQLQRRALRLDLPNDQYEPPKSKYTHDPALAYKPGGLGVAFSTQNGQLTIQKSKSAVLVLKTFKDFIKKYLNGVGYKTLLAHGRYVPAATPNDSIEKKDLHPIQIPGLDWVLIHHGTLSADAVQGLKGQTLDFESQSDVDSELIACYVATKLKREIGSANIKHLKTDQVLDVLQKAMQEVLPANENPQDPSGTYNLKISDGHRIFATSYSNPVKSLGIPPRPILQAIHTRQTDGKQELLLALEEMQPEMSNPIVWKAIPHNTIAAFEIDSTGKKIKARYRNLLPTA